MNTLSETRRKYFYSLGNVKKRREAGLFAVEGDRALSELLGTGLELKHFVATEQWWGGDLAARVDCDDCYVATTKDMKALSALQTAPDAIGFFVIPMVSLPSPDELLDSVVVALDDVQDPGNLGTIIRLADWWGVKTIVCSRNTVDCFNPKVVQASMGALARVGVVKTASLETFLADCVRLGVPVYGTFLGGENIFSARLSANGVIVMGNEGNGISGAVEKVVGRRLTIPCYPPGSEHVESLNVAMATATVLAEFRRRMSI